MSRPQVTITLGRTGQVVKKAGNVPDGFRFDSLSSAGSKRSTREGAGSNAESSLYETQSKTKRHRGDRSVWSSNDARVGRNDLRFKLMQKNKFRRTRGDYEGRNHKGLKRQLPRAVYSPVSMYTLRRMPESKVNGLLRRIPPTRSTEDLLQLNSSRKSYSTWTHNGLRCRSPDRILSASRGFSPPGNINDHQQVLTFRPIDSSRAAAYMATKQVSQLPPPNSIAQKNSYLGVEPLTVASFLHSLGLEKYIILFQAEEVDMTALKQMRDNDLKELGIPMGPRKKILLALSPHSKQV
ncbi:hypothetical protein PVL29_022560 [Vitis rotundifolia]|uniref:SAM domain-containing protein n=1 Tax=Vitis rotundifolia TaxID=103349 RepID=A0AA38YVV2_VITRO|nr:hypothetical protein PVL29_022560 [Vitis rotundifolia]